MINVFKSTPAPTPIEAPAPTFGQRLAAGAARGLLWVVGGGLVLLVGGMLVLTAPLLLLSVPPITLPMAAVVAGWFVTRRRTGVDLPAYISGLVDAIRGSGHRVWITAGVTGTVLLAGLLITGQGAGIAIQAGVAGAALVLLTVDGWRGGGRRGQ